MRGRNARRVCVLVVIALVVAVTACAPDAVSPSGAPGIPRPYGVVTQTWSPDHSRWAADLGVGWVRLDFNWFEIEPRRGVFDWGLVDERVIAAAGAGLRIYATLAYTPSWAGPCRHCMPTDLADWERFVAAVLEHYRWWGIVYGIWNEPNLQFLDDTDDAVGYGQLFAHATAVRARIDPGAALAGPETSHHAMPQYFGAAVSRMLPHMRPSDIVSVHYYPDASRDLDRYMNTARLASAGHRVWLTETGMHTCDEGAQAAWVTNALEAYAGEGRTWWSNVFVYVLHNGDVCGEAMVKPDGSYRASFEAYQRFIAAHP